jgi:hypothetical protein
VRVVCQVQVVELFARAPVELFPNPKISRGARTFPFSVSQHPSLCQSTQNEVEGQNIERPYITLVYR